LIFIFLLNLSGDIAMSYFENLNVKKLTLRLDQMNWIFVTSSSTLIAMSTYQLHYAVNY
jgi:hypothetical protein